MTLALTVLWYGRSDRPINKPIKINYDCDISVRKPAPDQDFSGIQEYKISMQIKNSLIINQRNLFYHNSLVCI